MTQPASGMYSIYFSESSKNLLSIVAPGLSRRPSHVEIYDAQLVALFLQNWMPVENIILSEKERLWLPQAVLVTGPTVALDLSLKALAFTRLGWLKHDDTLATRGNLLYGRALQELQKALWDKQLMWLDDTLAAAYTLSVYEVSIVSKR